MAHPYHHALSSARLWGGTEDDYLPLHTWFDESKMLTSDFRHRALRHHAAGIFMAERFFGPTITISTGRVVPLRLIGEQHVREDLGFIPSFADWARRIRPEPWMGRAQPIHRAVDPFAACGREWTHRSADTGAGQRNTLGTGNSPATVVPTGEPINHSIQADVSTSRIRRGPCDPDTPPLARRVPGGHAPPALAPAPAAAPSPWE